jgi:hypothetical protein
MTKWSADRELGPCESYMTACQGCIILGTTAAYQAPFGSLQTLGECTQSNPLKTRFSTHAKLPAICSPRDGPCPHEVDNSTERVSAQTITVPSLLVPMDASRNPVYEVRLSPDPGDS